MPKSKTKRTDAPFSKYGITQAQWLKMYELQDGHCATCPNPIYKPGNKEGKRAAHVDHDHKTGRVRGLTCHFCNRFRIARNTAETARRVYAYLLSSFDGRSL